ncbi:MAG TPA: bifunctional folylpolyglutamate synthase/dihydrofolate synthase [Clostridiales bacterium]|nr:bifunctional folylpolyglutamate synthase/dihydrofolate synthase [Clostridiales bacterium]
MTYEDARNFIKASNKYGIVPGLETMEELLGRLGNPQEKLKMIHVAGSNGKGSTCAFISTILIEAGYKVGRYSSPTVFTYREIIQIGYEGLSEMDYITEEGVCEAIDKIMPVCKDMLEDGYSHPTAFEIETAMAFLYLSQENVDFAIIEVGMGGRLDATNVIKQPICTVITSISMDHMQYLGSSLKEIAYQKAGIIKDNVPLVTCKQHSDVEGVLQEISAEKNAKYYVADTHKVRNAIYTPEKTRFTMEDEEYSISLLGEYQIDNGLLAITAARVIDKLGYLISEEAIKRGLDKTRWSGRFEVISRKPYFIIDGAHNEDAAIRLAKSIEQYFTNQRIIYIIGVLSDKDVKSILKITAPLADVIIALTPDNKRALASSDLANMALSYGKKVIDAATVDMAVKRAYQEATEDDVIIAFGSLSYLGELKQTVEDVKREKDI